MTDINIHNTTRFLLLTRPADPVGLLSDIADHRSEIADRESSEEGCGKTYVLGCLFDGPRVPMGCVLSPPVD